MQNIVLQNAYLTVEISRAGAEIQRIVDAQGISRLWHGDPAIWPGRSPILFPIAGSLKEDRYTLGGVSYTLAKHGFAKTSEFAVEAQDAGSVTLLLSPAQHQDAGYPFAYAFRVVYRLHDNSIEVSFETTNEGDVPLWYAAGAHEAYACPEGIEAYRLVFEKPEPLIRRVLDGSLLTHESEPVPSQEGVLPLGVDLFANDTLVFDRLASRRVSLVSSLHDRQVTVDYPDFDYLLIWTKPGAGFLCIEPWSTLPDAVDADGDITHKPGMTRVAPGQTHTRRHIVTLH